MSGGMSCVGRIVDLGDGGERRLPRGFFGPLHPPLLVPTRDGVMRLTPLRLGWRKPHYRFRWGRD